MSRTLVRIALCTVAATLLVVGAGGAGSAAPGDEVVSVAGRAEGLFVAIDVVLPAADVGQVTEGPLAAGSSSGGEVGAEQFDFEFGPAPTVTLPPGGGGPFTDALADIVVDTDPPTEPIATVASSEVSTEGALGAAGTARSSSTSLDVTIGGVNLGFESTEISSECETTTTGATASSTVADLFFDALPVDVPDDPAPNTVLTSADVPGLGTGVTVVLNEQEIVTDASGSHVVVTAFHLTAVEGNQSARGEAYLGRSECGITSVAPVVAAPTFTG